MFGRSRPDAAEAPAIHLRSASVDLDGNIVAAGTMSYVPDPGGLFPLAAHDQLRIDRTRALKVTPCRSNRDLRSGFLQSESCGPTLSLPYEFVPVILRALRHGPRERQSLALGHQTGWLSSAREGGDKSVSQQLSDWRLTLEERNGGIHVEMVAALRSTVPLIPDKPLDNHWSADSAPPPRMVVAFSVDAATRVACFGAHTPLIGEPTAEDRARGAPVPVPTSLVALNLEAAPIGPLLQFGSQGDRWINVYEGTHARPCLVLSPDQPGPKRPSGFLSHGGYGYPRLWFYEIDLNTIADAMGTSPLASVSLSNRNGSYVELGSSHGGPPPDPIVETISGLR